MPELRAGLFSLDPEMLKEPGRSPVPARLQNLFARLQLLDVESVSTTDLTQAFGWDDDQVAIQHDVQELARVLFEGAPGQTV